MESRERGGLRAFVVACVILAALLLLANNGCTKKPEQVVLPASYPPKGLILPYDVSMSKALTVTGTSYVGGASTFVGPMSADDVTLTGSVTGTFSSWSTGLSVYGGLQFIGGYMIDLRGAVTVTDDLLVTDQATVQNGLSLAGNFTMSNGSIYNSLGAVTVTDSIVQSGSTFMSDGYIINTKGAVTVSDDINMSGDLTMNVGGRIIQANGAVSVADAIDITGIAYAHDDIQALADVRITDYLIIEDVAAASIITVTGWITPTRSNQRILAEAWVTPTVNGGCVPGLMWFLYNWGAPNIYLADGSALILAGDFTMGQHDTLILMCNQGGNWAELSRSNN